jgi:hypothetical protein
MLSEIMKNCMFYIVFLLLSITPSHAQTEKIIAGVYKGGVCMDEGICGYWLLKLDSSFVFVNFEGDYLKYFGKGRWAVENGCLVRFSFQEDQVPVLQQINAAYFSTTKEPFDSLYIFGQLRNKLNATIDYASIIVNNKYQTVSDSNGYFKLRLPRTFIPKNLIVIKKIDGYAMTEFLLNPANNSHEINLCLAKFDSTMGLPIYNSNPILSSLSSNEIKLKLNTKTDVDYNTVSLVTKENQFITDKLKKAQRLQPSLNSNITELLLLLEQ